MINGQYDNSIRVTWEYQCSQEYNYPMTHFILILTIVFCVEDFHVHYPYRIGKANFPPRARISNVGVWQRGLISIHGLIGIHISMLRALRGRSEQGEIHTTYK